MAPEEIIARAVYNATMREGTFDRLPAHRRAKLDAQARAALRALDEAGFRVVPVDLTKEMWQAAANEPLSNFETGEETFVLDPTPMWRAMLDAAGRSDTLSRDV